MATPADGVVVGATQLVDNGPDSDRFTIVLVAEGYQQAELPDFGNHAQQFADFFLSTPPFDTNCTTFNLWRIDVASDDSGVDVPGACAGTEVVVDTYFDATFSASICRLLTVNNGNVISVLNANVPNWDAAIVIVNTTIYGGAGGTVGTTSLAGSWELIAIHELGHSAFGLADEYEYYKGCGSEADRNNHPATEPGEANVTIETDRGLIKWGDLIAASTPVPTSTNANCTMCDPQPDPFPGQQVVGLYEGAHYYHCDAFRPVFNCMMRNFAVFCPVCERKILSDLAPFKAGSPPIADAGPDRVVECTGVTTAVTLDGTDSSDPDCNALTFMWSAIGVTFDDPTSATPTGQFRLGTTTVTLKVTDGDGEEDTDTVDVMVEDSTAPGIVVELNRDILWPPNHKMADITADVMVTEICDPNPTFVLTSITSNEPDNAKGDGNTVDDIQGASFGTADVEFQLRSERSGRGNGRKYTITYTATDGSGNTSTAVACVRVPHDQSGNTIASSGFLPDGTGLARGASSYFLVIRSVSENAEQSLVDVNMINPRRAFVGNHLVEIPALSSRISDVDGDHIGDLILEYPAVATLELARLSAQDAEAVAFRYEDRSRTGYLVADIFALGVPVLLPGRPAPPDEVADKTPARAPEVAIPLRTGFAAIQPNPFNPSTTVSFELAADGLATIEVYDPRGVRVRTLVRGVLPTGRHEVTWNGRDERDRSVPSGMYFFRLLTRDVTETRKALLMK